MKRNRRPEEKLSHMSRREALAALGGIGLSPMIYNPVGALIGGLVSGIIREAQAGTTAPPRNFIYIHQGGGPARWYFDNPLTPYGGNFVKNPHVNTRFQNTGGTNAGVPEYGTVSLTRNGVTVNMPQLWGCNIPTPGGGTASMAALLDNALMIRGVNMGVDGHDLNGKKQLRPVNSAPSSNGSVADISSKLLPAVGLPGAPNDVYKSAKGIGMPPIPDYLRSYSTPLPQILGPFDRSQDGLPSTYTGTSGRRAAMDTAMNIALDALAAHANARMPGSDQLYVMRNKAEAQIRAGLGAAQSQYTALHAKYTDLISRSATTPMPGITDKPVLYSMIQSNFTTQGVGTKPTFLPSGLYCTNPDLRTLLAADTDNGLAGGFAVAEYLIVNGFSSSVVFGGGSVGNIHPEGPYKQGDPANGIAPAPVAFADGIFGFDEHFFGSVVSMICGSFNYRALAACMYEFIQVMKANNLWQETVIQIGGDFGRTPRSDQSGSDHGWMACNSSMYSGAITKPIIIGNINSQGSGYAAGTFGEAGLVNVDGTNQELTIGHVSSTLATLLRTQPLQPNNGSLVSDTGTSIVPQIENARNI